MLVIVAHHYVVNSGLVELIQKDPAFTFNDVFLLIFGWGGKTGINCFVLITGYFMCTSSISLRKFLKLLAEIEFYNILVYLIFVAFGYTAFSVTGFIRTILPVTEIANHFVPCFLVFYLLIPFLNKLIHALNEREHMLLILLSLFVLTIMPTLMMEVSFNYVTWFSVLFLIASYIRLYPKAWMENNRICGWLALLSLLLSWGSMLGMSLVGKQAYYHFVSDSNKIFALTTAVCAFLFFRNLKIPQSKFINAISASCFGVMLIHANSGIMKQWLWTDTLKVTSFYDSPYLVLHAIAAVLGIYVICTVIDQIRIRTVEKWFMAWFDRHYPSKKTTVPQG